MAIIDPGARRNRLKRISDERIEYVQDNTALFLRAIEDTAAAMRSGLVEALAGLTPAQAAKAQTLIDLRRALQKEINTSPYNAAVEQFIQAYAGVDQFALAALEAMGIKIPRLSALDAQALRNLRAADYRFLKDIPPAAARVVATGVMQNALMGLGRAEMIDRAYATIGTRLRNHAATYVDTALVSYDRRVSSTIWQAAGLARYMYRGPRDIKNRVFCGRLIGKVFTIQEINAMDNGRGQPKPVMVYGGGWNCRHVWTPVPPEEPPPAIAQPEPELPPAIAPQAKPAQREKQRARRITAKK